MWRYFELLSFRPLEQVAALKAAVAEGRNPMEVKFALAHELTARFHGESGAAAARRDFDQRIRAGAMPEDIEQRVVTIEGVEIGLAAALTAAGLTASNSEAFREIRQRAVRVDGERVEDQRLMLKAGERYVLAVGKRRIVEVELRSA
jgi:tyrosyl-tRNA synthetase